MAADCHRTDRRSLFTNAAAPDIATSPEHYFPVYGALGTTDPDRAVSPSPAEKEVTLVRARKAFHSEIAANRRNILVN